MRKILIEEWTPVQKVTCSGCGEVDEERAQWNPTFLPKASLE